MVKPVGDFELQFERLDALETQTASRKPFPEDFSFDKDGSLRDCKTKENAVPETVAMAEPKPEEPGGDVLGGEHYDLKFGGAENGND